MLVKHPRHVKPPRGPPRSPVVRELERDAEILLLEEGNHRLQLVAALARHAELVALDLGLDLELAVADRLGDVLGLVRGDALGDRPPLADRPGQRVLDLAVIQRLQGHAALDELVLEDVDYALELRVVVRHDHQRLVLFLQGHAALAALEIEPLLQFLDGLIQPVLDILDVDLGHHVERILVGHDPVSFPSPRAAYVRSSAASACPSPFASRVSRSGPSIRLPPASRARRRAPSAAATSSSAVSASAKKATTPPLTVNRPPRSISRPGKGVSATSARSFSPMNRAPSAEVSASTSANTEAPSRQIGFVARVWRRSRSASSRSIRSAVGGPPPSASAGNASASKTSRENGRCSPHARSTASARQWRRYRSVYRRVPWSMRPARSGRSRSSIRHADTASSSSNSPDPPAPPACFASRTPSISPTASGINATIGIARATGCW